MQKKVNNKNKDNKVKKRFNTLYQKIETKEQATLMIRDVSGILYVLAIINAVVYTLLKMYYGLLDAAILIILGLLIYKTKSKIVACIILIYAILAFITTLLAKLGMTKGGTNIILAILLVWYSIRGVQATFVYNRR